MFTEGDVCSPQANVEPDPSLDLLAAAGGRDVGLVLGASADGATVPAVAEVGNQYDASDKHGREHANSCPQTLYVGEIMHIIYIHRDEQYCCTNELTSIPGKCIILSNRAGTCTI